MSDPLYVHVQRPGTKVARTVDVGNMVFVDYDAKGGLVGVEIISPYPTSKVEGRTSSSAQSAMPNLVIKTPVEVPDE